MRPVPIALLLGAALALVGCPAREQGVAAPADFRVGRFGVFTQVSLEWTPAAGVDGYELEGRAAGNAWGSLLDPGELLPPDVVGTYIDFPEDLRELLTLEFRIRSARGGARSAWVVAAFDTGIRWPEEVQARATPIVDFPGGPTGRFTGPVTLTWVNRSAIATQVRLERTPDEAAWEPLPAGPPVAGANSFVDDTVWDGGSIRYRIRLGTASGWSAPVYADSAVDVVAPRDLAAVREAGGVRVSWSHRGRASTLSLYRQSPEWYGEAELLSGLPAGSGSVLDPITAEWPGLYWPGIAYRLSATGPYAWSRVWTAPLVLAAIDLSEPLPLRGDSVGRLPWDGFVAATQEGLLHIAGSGGAVRDTGAGWEAETLAGFLQFAMPGVRADGEGHPHWVYLRTDAPGLQTLVHVWWDGAWRYEDLAVAWDRGASFDVAPDGTLHVLFDTPYAPPDLETWDVVYLAGRTGAWTREILATNTNTTGMPYVTAGRVTVAPDGTGLVLLDRRRQIEQVYEQDALLVTRDPSGAIALEPVPLVVGNTLGFGLLGGANGGDAALVQALHDWELDRYRTLLLRRVGGAWQPEEEIEGYDGNDLFSSALSPDGSRLFLALTRLYPHHLELRLRTGAGWSRGAIGPSAPWRVHGGFWPDGRLHLEVVLDSGGSIAGARYREPDPP